MKRLRQAYPRTFPVAMGTIGAVAGWGIGVAVTRTPNPWGLGIVAAFCLIGMVVCVRELRDARRRLAALEMIQQAIETRDEGLLEAAYLQMKYLDSPGRWSHRRSKI